MERTPLKMFTQAASRSSTRPEASFDAVASSGQVHMITNMFVMAVILTDCLLKWV
jgi:hypothetical protein